MTVRVGIWGNGQLGSGVAAQLHRRPDIELIGPVARPDSGLLSSGADVVIIATSTFLADVAPDIERALDSGSNVIVSAEEAAFPWAGDAELARRLDAVACERGVTALGTGVNPGFIFDALVLTLTGTGTTPTALHIHRTVDISRFGPVVRGRLGLDFPSDAFDRGVQGGSILGHAGFPQSIRIVADALGVSLSGIDRVIEPVFAETTLTLGGYSIKSGRTVGVRQVYTGNVDDQPWYRATFMGHVAPGSAGLTTRDEIRIESEAGVVNCLLEPGIPAQSGSASVIANSIDRVIAAAPGWTTVAYLPPAVPHR